MIPEANMLAFITQLYTTGGVTILRADQMAKKPAYPYATYKEIISNEEAAISNIKEKTYDEEAQEVTETTNELSETTISINVFSSTHAEAKTKAEILRYALKTKAVNNKAKELTMTILLGLTPVQDRTIVFEGVQYEYCFGFDFVLRSNLAHEETFESIETITGIVTTIAQSGVEQESEFEVTT